MGMDIYYTFFDHEAFDPVWRMTWLEFLRKYRPNRSTVEELLEFAWDGEIEERGLDKLDGKTLKWTLARSSPQFFVMSEIMEMCPRFRKHRVHVQVRYMGDGEGLIGAGIERWVQKKTSSRTLAALMKVHAIDKPSDTFELPPRVASRVDRLVSAKQLEKPIYAWQGSAFNCLGIADTRRFISFLRRAWEEDWPTPRLRPDFYGSIEADIVTRPTVRMFKAIEDLHDRVKDIERLRRPSVLLYSE